MRLGTIQLSDWVANWLGINLAETLPNWFKHLKLAVGF